MSEWLNKPYYLFRPTQIARRTLRALKRQDGNEREEVRLPWGLNITINSSERMGSAIARSGVYDLCVCEAIYRLADPGELAVDVGANIGQMTSVMAARVRDSGKVLAFEPHPETFAELRENVNRWEGRPGIAPIVLHEMGLSDHAGASRRRSARSHALLR